MVIFTGRSVASILRVRCMFKSFALCVEASSLKGVVFSRAESLALGHVRRVWSDVPFVACDCCPCPWTKYNLHFTAVSSYLCICATTLSSPLPSKDKHNGHELRPLPIIPS